HPAQIMVTTGGTLLKEDILRLEQPVHVIVATPGRLLDLAKRKLAKLNFCQYLAMDEADKLLSPAMLPVIESLLSFLPQKRQLVMFSATFPVSVKDFRDKHCHRPQEINLMEELTLKGITQVAF